MVEHITFKEMSDFVFSDTMDEKTRALGEKIYAHISECEECNDLYNQALAVENALEAMSLCGLEKHIARAMLFEQSSEDGSHTLINEWMNKADAMFRSIKISIHNYGEIIVDNLEHTNTYQYPEFAAFAKSVNINSDDVQVGVSKSTMVDEQNNRISIGLDGTLSLYFNRDKCDIHSWVLLAPINEEELPRMGQLQSYDNQFLVARFNNMVPGEYIVVLQDGQK